MGYTSSPRFHTEESSPLWSRPSTESANDVACRAGADDCLAWPPIPEGMQGIQIVAIARIVERVCGTSAAAVYLMEAVAAFDKKPKP